MRTSGVDEMAPPLLELADVDSGYGEAQILYAVSISVAEGELVCLIGPNGAGKSTVLKTVFGLLAPWAGTITYAGAPIGGEPPADVVRTGIGYVPQRRNVFGSLTIEENLQMGAVARDDDGSAVIAGLYEQFPLLADKRAARASTLSGGQRQILAFARALVPEPQLLLIDEPSAGLAPNTAEEVFAHVEAVNARGTAVLMVEQNAKRGLAISDRGVVLDQGAVEFTAPADAVLEDERIAELYLGG